MIVRLWKESTSLHYHQDNERNPLLSRLTWYWADLQAFVSPPKISTGALTNKPPLCQVCLLRLPFYTSFIHTGNRHFHYVYPLLFLSLTLFCSFSSYPQLFTGYSPPWFIQNNVSSAFQRNPQTRGMISLFQSFSLSLSSSLPFLLFSLPVFSVPIGFPSGYPRYQIILGENHTLSRIGLFGKLVTRLCFWTKCSLGIVSIIGLP